MLGCLVTSHHIIRSTTVGPYKLPQSTVAWSFSYSLQSVRNTDFEQHMNQPLCGIAVGTVYFHCKYFRPDSKPCEGLAWASRLGQLSDRQCSGRLIWGLCLPSKAKCSDQRCTCVEPCWAEIWVSASCCITLAVFADTSAMALRAAKPEDRLTLCQLQHEVGSLQQSLRDSHATTSQKCRLALTSLTYWHRPRSM